MDLGASDVPQGQSSASNHIAVHSTPDVADGQVPVVGQRPRVSSISDSAQVTMNLIIDSRVTNSTILSHNATVDYESISGEAEDTANPFLAENQAQSSVQQAYEERVISRRISNADNCAPITSEPVQRVAESNPLDGDHSQMQIVASGPLTRLAT